MPADEAGDLALLVAAAEEAGALAMRYFRKDPKSWLKHPASPVTEADLAADAILRARLLAARPDYGWLSEETEDDASRRTARRTFVVDPIDGTKSFIAGTDDWVVSAAVVADGRPVAGVLVRPVLGETYAAAAGHGAWLNGAPLALPPPQAVLRIAGPQRMVRRVAESGLAAEKAPHVHSLALRIALVAAGRHDLALANAAAYDWDVAAADVILLEAGGILVGRDGQGLAYNAPDPRHPPLIAGTPATARRVAAVFGP